jgi:hypothetical protein
MSHLAPSITEIEPSLFIGSLSSSWRLETLRNKSITSIVSLTDAKYALWNRTPNQKLVPEDHRLHIPCLDSMTMDLLVHMADICDFIDKQLSSSTTLPPATPSGPPDETGDPEQHDDDAQTSPTTSGRVLVHCQQGKSRSAAAVIAYLMRKRGETLDVVLADVKSKRKVKPNDNFLEQLKVWEEVEYEAWLDKERSIPKESYRAYLERRASRLKELGLTGDEPIGITGL